MPSTQISEEELLEKEKEKLPLLPPSALVT
jgi:hypothetical protein